MRGYLHFWAGVTLTVLIVGCAATGRHFDAGKLSALTPGQTTLDEASRALTALPDRVYRQTDGSLLALWSFKITYVADALYRRKEALLQFGADGRLMRLADSVNIGLKPWERQKLLGPMPMPVSDVSQEWAQQPAPDPQAEILAIPVPAAPPEPMRQGR